jgi:hypothetical protein
LRPAQGSTLHAVLAHTEDPGYMLSALLTLGEQDCVGEVRVEGDVVFEGRP